MGNNDEIIDDFSDLEFTEPAPKENSNDNGNLKVKTDNTVNKVDESLKHTEEAPKKPVNKKLIIGIAAGVVVLASGGTALYLNRTINADKHIQVAEATPDVSYVFEVDDSPVVDTTTTVEDEPKIESYEVNVPNADYALDINESTDVMLKVNTKLEGDESYKDYESPIKVEYSNFIFGYDNVEEYVTLHNENSNNIVNIPTREDFYALKSHSDLAVFEFTIEIPEDFPTNDYENGTIGINPGFNFEIFSTKDDTDKLITNLYEFEVPEFQYIGDEFKSLVVGEKYTLRYIAMIPYGLPSENYGAKLVLRDSMNSSNEIVFNIAPQETISEKDFEETLVLEETDEETVDETEEDKTVEENNTDN